MNKDDETWKTLQTIAAGDGEFIMRGPDGKEFRAKLLPLANGNIGLFAVDDIVEGETVKSKRLGRGK